MEILFEPLWEAMPEAVSFPRLFNYGNQMFSFLFSIPVNMEEVSHYIVK